MAEHVEGTVDVDGMLERMSPERFAEWCAKDLVEPIGYHVQVVGLIAWMMHSYLSSDSDSDSDVKPEDFMPWLRYAPKDKGASAEQVMQMLAPLIRR